MKPRMYLLAGLALALLGSLAWWVFSKKTLPKQIQKAVEDDLAKINTVTATLTANTFTKTEVVDLFARQTTGAPPASNNGGTGGTPGLSLTVEATGQTEFALPGQQSYVALFLNGERLPASAFTIQGAQLTYHYWVVLDTTDELTLA